MKRLQKNMGDLDRILRFLIAGLVVFLYLDGIIRGNAAYIVLLVSIATMLTALSGYCPLYPILGWNTSKRN